MLANWKRLRGKETILPPLLAVAYRMASNGSCSFAFERKRHQTRERRPRFQRRTRRTGRGAAACDLHALVREFDVGDLGRGGCGAYSGVDGADLLHDALRVAQLQGCAGQDVSLNHLPPAMLPAASRIPNPKARANAATVPSISANQRALTMAGAISNWLGAETTAKAITPTAPYAPVHGRYQVWP